MFNLIVMADALVFTDLAVIKFFRKTVNAAKIKGLRTHILEDNDKAITLALLNRLDLNPLSILFDRHVDSGIDLDSIYNEIMTDEKIYISMQEDFIITGVLELIKTMSKIDNEMAVKVLCKNQIDKQYIELKTGILEDNIIIGELKDWYKYGSFIVKDIYALRDIPKVDISKMYYVQKSPFNLVGDRGGGSMLPDEFRNNIIGTRIVLYEPFKLDESYNVHG